MCGIVTIYSYHDKAPNVDREELRLIRDAMINRGPDGSGEWFSRNGRVAMGHRRLSIIDLSENAAQPMTSADGRLEISFNGEIYNYRALRQDLEKKGCRFRSQSDTEVLLHLYAEKGEVMVHDLRGMFAFAIWDDRKQGLFLARDPYGIKPLYYADDGQSMKAASQVKALLAGNGISKTKDAAGIAGFFLFGSVPEPFTFYQAIKALPAGHTLWTDGRGVAEPQKYFSISEVFHQALLKDPPQNQKDEDAIQAALLDTVRHHFVADVPVGVFLSAGLDSGALVGLARDAGMHHLRTVTLAYREFRGTPHDEAPLAEEVAKIYGTTHQTRMLEKEEFHREIPKIFEAMDQPSIDGINSYFVSKAVKENGLKVVLSGLGGDELFGGYASFQEIPRLVKMLALPSQIPGLGDLFTAARHLPLAMNPKFSGLLKYGGTYPGAYYLCRGLFMPWELAGVLGPELAREGLKQFDPLSHLQNGSVSKALPPFAKVASMEASFYLRNQLLRDADWAGMAHSVEIRTPYVDAWLFKALVPLLLSIKPGKISSPHFLKNRFLARAPAVPLPEKVIHRPKTGFGLPMAPWLEDDKQFDAWRGIPALQRPACHWSRRWAYVLYRAGQGTASYAI